jgi:SAM-dependent methyltransferase
MAEPADLLRLREEYADRARRLDAGYYSPFNLPNLFASQQRARQVLHLLHRGGVSPLGGWRILEVGCGGGGVLLDLLTWGAQSAALHGIDLLPHRLAVARQLLPASPLLAADARRLPYPARTFDLALQFTAFSSVLDEEVKRQMAREMLRVLKPTGGILWYDFWWNPANPHTRGIRPAEVRALFPACTITFRRITLAPPIARRLVPVSWLLAGWLEKLTIFNSHYLALIRPASPA